MSPLRAAVKYEKQTVGTAEIRQGSEPAALVGKREVGDALAGFRAGGVTVVGGLNMLRVQLGGDGLAGHAQPAELPHDGGFFGDVVGDFLARHHIVKFILQPAVANVISIESPGNNATIAVQMKSIGILALAAVLPAAAQWLDHRDARTPRTRDGKPDLAAPAPRINGKLDLSGVWQAERTPVSELTQALGEKFTREQVDFNDATKHALNIFWDLKPGEDPSRPEAAAILKQRRQMVPPLSRCLPAGVPMSLFVYSFKIIQAPDEIVMITESGDPARQIHTDGRALPEDPQPAWVGYSVGKWEGDTLAVDTTGFNQDAWLDGAGHPRSESMHLRERYHRLDFGHMNIEITIDDPKYYTRPYTFSAKFHLIPDSDVLEFVCAENEKDSAHNGKR